MTDTSKQGQRCEDVIRFKVDRLQCQLQIGHSGEHAAYGLEWSDGVQWSDPQTQPSAPAAMLTWCVCNHAKMAHDERGCNFFGPGGCDCSKYRPAGSAPAEPSAPPVSRNMDYEIPELISNLKADIALYEETGNQQDFVDALAGIKEILRKAEPSAGEGQLWKLQPDEQAWWWHWNGEDYSIPHIFSVMVSKSGSVDRYFVSYPDSRWCDEIGGFWLKVAYPNVPTRNEQAKLRAALAGKGNENG